MKDSQLYCHMEYPIYLVDRLPTCSAPEGDCEFYIYDDIAYQAGNCGYNGITELGIWKGELCGEVKPKEDCPFHTMKDYL